MYSDVLGQRYLEGQDHLASRLKLGKLTCILCPPNSPGRILGLTLPNLGPYTTGGLRHGGTWGGASSLSSTDWRCCLCTMLPGEVARVWGYYWSYIGVL